MLKGEIDPAADHSEIISRAVDHAKADIVDPADLRCDASLESGAELSEKFGVRAVMDGVSVGDECVGRKDQRVREELIAFAAAKDRADTGISIRRETGARHRVAERERSEERSNSAMMCEFFARENSEARIFENIETAFASIDYPTFETNTEITVKEIFEVESAAPRMIVADVAIVFAEHRTSFSRAFSNVDQIEIARVIGIGEQIRAPKRRVPFIVGVPFGAWRRRGLFHFFAAEITGVRSQQKNWEESRD